MWTVIGKTIMFVVGFLMWVFILFVAYATYMGW